MIRSVTASMERWTSRRVFLLSDYQREFSMRPTLELMHSRSRFVYQLIFQTQVKSHDADWENHKNGREARLGFDGLPTAALAYEFD